MFRVTIFYPPAMTTPVVKYYKSLRHASMNLQTSYYFLYNCYHRRHNNQFSQFFDVQEVDGDGRTMPYRKPRNSDKRGKAKHKGKHKTKHKGKDFKKMVNLHSNPSPPSPPLIVTNQLDQKIEQKIEQKKQLADNHAITPDEGERGGEYTECGAGAQGWCDFGEQWAPEY